MSEKRITMPYNEFLLLVGFSMVKYISALDVDQRKTMIRECMQAVWDEDQRSLKRQVGMIGDAFDTIINELADDPDFDIKIEEVGE